MAIIEMTIYPKLMVHNENIHSTKIPRNYTTIILNGSLQEFQILVLNISIGYNKLLKRHTIKTK